MTSGHGDISTVERVRSAPAREPLLAECYADMRRIARNLMAQESRISLQPTDLAHEAAIRLMGLDRIDIGDRGHMLALTARLMRQSLIDEVRKVRAAKRQAPSTLTSWPGGGPQLVELDVLDDALRALAEVSAEHAEVVELRFSLGLSIEETAVATGIAARTVKRRWQAARAWLQRYLETDGTARCT